ncbi:protein adenylyltransferase Fic [Caerostris extrusa]|uniref:UDP-N-acetylglucosamine transferase subunit ALG13 n=1 Tax=Caerostris extrusa TaxID=172846 RepID=A0AAV4MP12_CAEEX|nr:protein adenylyltransferase Fic [Caerostris extrusa]
MEIENFRSSSHMSITFLEKFCDNSSSITYIFFFPFVCLSMSLFITVGSTSFDELIQTVTSPEVIKTLAGKGFKKVILQIGRGTVIPPKSDIIEIEWFRYKDSISQNIKEASFIIGHAGAGTILESLIENKPLIAVLNENLMDNHQTELAQQMAIDGYLAYCSCSNLLETLKQCLPIPNFLPDSNEAEEPVYLDEPIAIPNLKYKNHGTEEEALKVLQLAVKFKNSSKLEKAKKLFEHALSLQPLQPDVLNSYAEFLEEHANDLITADHLYVKTLTLCPNHSKALINRNRTMSIVELMDEQEFVKIDKKRNDLINRNHNESFMKHIKKEVYFLHIHHTVAIEGNTMSLAETRKVVETKLVIPGKSIREHNEILGLDSALRFMNQTYVNHSRPLSLFDILQIHNESLVM